MYPIQKRRRRSPPCSRIPASVSVTAGCRRFFPRFSCYFPFCPASLYPSKSSLETSFVSSELHLFLPLSCLVFPYYPCRLLMSKFASFWPHSMRKCTQIHGSCICVCIYNLLIIAVVKKGCLSRLLTIQGFSSPAAGSLLKPASVFFHIIHIAQSEIQQQWKAMLLVKYLKIAFYFTLLLSSKENGWQWRASLTAFAFHILHSI